SETKIAAEWLLDVGEAICVRREGWRRVYDLPERVVPGELLDHDPSDAECLAHLAGVAARALGVVTRADIIDYHPLNHLSTTDVRPTKGVEESALAAGLTPVAIDGAGAAPIHAWADPAMLAQAAAARGRHRVTLLSPFDSLVWDRKRTLRMFGFEHSLEAYVPKPKRGHRDFSMPLLAGGRRGGRGWGAGRIGCAGESPPPRGGCRWRGRRPPSPWPGRFGRPPSGSAAVRSRWSRSAPRTWPPACTPR